MKYGSPVIASLVQPAREEGNGMVCGSKSPSRGGNGGSASDASERPASTSAARPRSAAPWLRDAVSASPARGSGFAHARPSA
jgi:hypothetical protein